MQPKSNYILIVFISFFILIFTQYVSAQENIIKMDALGLVQGTQRITYERKIIPQLSALINLENGNYYGKRTVVIGNALGEIYNIKGYGIMPELRFYPFINSNKYDGIFIGAHYHHRWITENFHINIDPVLPDPNNKPLVSTKGIMKDYGANLGYRYCWHFFVFEALAGFGIVNGAFETPNARDLIYDRIKKLNLSENKFALRTQLSIGFTFPYSKKQNYQDSLIKNTRTL